MPYLPSVAFLADSIGMSEWVVLFVVILIVVGPQKLPGLARKIGRTMEMFRRAADEFKEQLMSMDQPPPSPPSAPSSPSDVDGVPQSDATADSNATPSNDAYPNMGDYPGNEDQVENWSGETSPSEQHLADGTTSATDGAPKADAGVAPAEPKKDTSAEGGA